MKHDVLCFCDKCRKKRVKEYRNDVKQAKKHYEKGINEFIKEYKRILKQRGISETDEINGTSISS